ncbi:MAG: hypothetical protein K8I65_15080 [Thermoanaerobaculia bacterium]|nr:hypothetical protein [Thermoanaerobaculia bacterium]
MAITDRPTRRVPPHNPHPHLAVKLDPDDPGRYVESVVYDKATGERLVRFPIDCKEMIASGSYVATEAECDPA